jgi:acetoacetyl-CoA synthetase
MPSLPLWTPSPERRARANLTGFMNMLRTSRNIAVASYDELHALSVSRPDLFWSALWDDRKIRAAFRGGVAVEPADHPRRVRFFPEARLNYAENLLWRGNRPEPAVIFRGENRVRLVLSWAELNARVARFARLLESLEIGEGDRVCGIVPNHPDTLAAFLAANAIGAIWSSCSPDFGERAVLDRFGQIAPRVLIACDGYYYAGKTIDIGDKTRNVASAMPSVERVLLIDYAGTARNQMSKIPGALCLGDAAAEMSDAPIRFAQMPFDHPVFILFSSGTTGVPKCIVHRAGGILLKHLSELVLNTDLKPGDRLFYYSTCGWMMWNWLVSGLAAGATLLLYDGSPFHPDERALFDFAEEEAMSVFGTSAKYIDAVKKTGWRPRDTHEFAALRTMCSTGSPLAPESFDFVYEAIKSDLHLASISGGTDICGCFVAGNPLAAVHRGEIQCATLGLAVAVFGDDGRPLRRGKGELVCTNAFPSMPVGFWNDPDGSKYHAAYFSRFDKVWRHGDFAEWTEHGGMIIHGRSDATLNPGGVRIGTAEIYAEVEQVPEVLEALAIGQQWDGDQRIVLFVKLKPGTTLDADLRERIRRQIRAGASPRHVPAKILAIADIPRTKSGKITELAVRDVVHGLEVRNRDALANPEALDLYRDLAELKC